MVTGKVTGIVTLREAPWVRYRHGVDAVQVAEIMRSMWLLFGAVVGACLGSFANVVVARLPQGHSVVHPPSRCPACKKPIAPWDNIPVVSWLILRGKARCCGIPISPRYVLVEALGLGLGYAVVVLDGPGPSAIFHGLMLLCLVCIALIDLDTFLVPPALSMSLAALATVAQGWLWWDATGNVRDTAVGFASGPLLGAVLGWGTLAGLRVTATFVARRTGRIGPEEDAMGRGDEDMMWGIGAMLGPGGLFWALAMGCAQGAAVGYGLRAVRRGQGHTQPMRGLAAPEATGTPEATPAADSTEGDDGWEPPADSIQLGPFLALGAVEALFVLPWLPPLDLVAAVQALWGQGGP